MDITPTALAQACDISVPFASQLLNGTRAPSNAVAVRIYRRAGLQLGVLAGLDAAAAQAVAANLEGRVDHAPVDSSTSDAASPDTQSDHIGQQVSGVAA